MSTSKRESETTMWNPFTKNEDGKIVEHWDVLQVVPSASANLNTMF